MVGTPLISLILIAFYGDHHGIADRIRSDRLAGKPIVVHAVVALCDNDNQGIAPVPAQLGNGQDPRSNLYWGAMYGVRTYLTRHAGWQQVASTKLQRTGVLDSIVLQTSVANDDSSTDVYMVAEAWDGRSIEQSIARFLRLAAGWDSETIELQSSSKSVAIVAGGAAHVIVFVGHNGLMDFTVENVPKANAEGLPRSSMVLACMSRSYFEGPLREGGSFPVLLTNGRMAPEAYTLDAAIRSWLLVGDTPDAVCDAAAKAYDKFQKCGMAAARRLFAAERK